ncbi:hypothetical protein [Actinoplanes sp. NPDC051411]|uniref:hypothetical protein n=1 Tax=Actinoplanes sp. NPDC051411 TaxID=3155522 RepID=UPI00344522F3
MTAPPVFVVHGIANRDEGEFENRVRHLADRTGRGDIHAVYWGDLGADDTYVPLVVPHVPPRRPVRGGAEPDETDPAAIALGGAADLPDAPALELFLVGVRRPGKGLRYDEADVAAAIRQAWLDDPPEWLWGLTDAGLLAELGAVTASTTLELLGADDGYPMRSSEHVRRVAGAVLRQTDRVAAATLGAAAARFLSWARRHAARAVALNVGDLLSYQRHRGEVLDRLRRRIAEVAGPGAGLDPVRPVHLVGHSLGAVIALDAATAAEAPVHAASMVTFGSHWSLLHLWRPDAGVPAYTGEPVPLPGTIRRWTNLWERFDLLAFLAAPLFTLADGSRPRDVELRQGDPATLFSHSVYWESPALLTALAEAWDGDDDG